MFNLSLFSVSSGLIQTQAILLVSGSVVPTAVAPGQMPVITNSSMPTPLVGTTAIVANPHVANEPTLSVAAIPPCGTVPAIPSSNVATPPVSTVPSIASTSIASLLPVGTSVSLSSASPSQPPYQPLVVVNTPLPTGAPV